MFYIWLAWKSFRVIPWLGLSGLILGVSCLVLTMGIVSGYEATLKKSLQESIGHIFVMKTPLKESFSPIEEWDMPELVSETPFVLLEAVWPQKGKLSGVIIEGVDEDSVNNVLNLSQKIEKGSLNFERKNSAYGALIGKGLAKRFNVSLGDEFSLVLPLKDQTGLQNFIPRRKKFYVTGILDLGRHDYNERYVIMDLPSAQAFGNLKNQVTGFRLKTTDPENTEDIVQKIESQAPAFLVSQWKDYSSNLLKAIEVEKIMLFFIVFIMVITSSFNISSSLFVHALKKSSEISVLKTVGVTSWGVLFVFGFYGLMVGVLGGVLGLLLGLIFSFLFVQIQSFWPFLPSDIYKLSFVSVNLQWNEMGWILLSSVGVCLLFSLIPAYKASRMMPSQGVKYE